MWMGGTTAIAVSGWMGGTTTIAVIGWMGEWAVQLYASTSRISLHYRIMTCGAQNAARQNSPRLYHIFPRTLFNSITDSGVSHTDGIPRPPCPSLCLSLSVSLSVSVSLALSVCLSVSPSLFVSASLCAFLSIPFSFLCNFNYIN